MSSSQSPHLVLAGCYELSGCGALRSELLRVAGEAAGGPVHLDLGAVTGGDVGLVQLLLSFEASLVSAGRRLTATASDAVRALFERAGAPLPAAV